jgi:hypothetical protein
MCLFFYSKSGDFDFAESTTSFDLLSPTSVVEDGQADIDDTLVDAGEHGSGRQEDDEGSGTPTPSVVDVISTTTPRTTDSSGE